MKKLILIVLMLFNITFYAQNFKTISDTIKIDMAKGIRTNESMDVEGFSYTVYTYNKDIRYIKTRDTNFIEMPLYIGYKTDCFFENKEVYTDFNKKYYCVFRISNLSYNPYVYSLIKDDECNFRFDGKSGKYTDKTMYIDSVLFDIFVIDDEKYITYKDLDNKLQTLFIGYKSNIKNELYDIYSNRNGSSFYIIKLNEFGLPFKEPYK